MSDHVMSLNPSQIAFLTEAIAEEEHAELARKAYLETARRAIYALSGLYPDLPDWHNNRNSWTACFGLRVPHRDHTPEMVAAEFLKQLEANGVTTDDLYLWHHAKSLPDHYHFRVARPEEPGDFRISGDYFTRSFVWFLYYAQGVDPGTDFRHVNAWVNTYREAGVEGSSWSAPVANLEVKVYQNGRVDIKGEAKAQVWAVVGRLFELYELDRIRNNARQAAIGREREMARKQAAAWVSKQA